MKKHVGAVAAWIVSTMDLVLDMIGIKKKSIRMFIKFLIFGGVTAVVDFFVFIWLTLVMHVNYLLSVAISFSFAIVVNYTLNKYLNFQSSNKSHARQLTVFSLVALIGLALSEVLLYVSVEFLGIHVVLARVLILFIVAPVNFFVHKTITFRE
jgi:putative flippase GtrA